MKTDLLIDEYKYYQGVKSKLIEESEGKFALIKGSELLGLFDTDMDAYQVAISKFGNVPFLIIRVSREEEQYWIPALELGLLDADH
jgi:hypothetical protein